MKTNLSKMLLVSFLCISIIAAGASVYAYDKKESKGWGFEEKFNNKVKKIMSNAEELELSDVQLKQIKDLKIKTKKDLIRQKAEIDIIALDIKSEMYQDDIDKGTINKLIDKKYDLKKEQAKTVVGACADIQNILTKGQQEKMKAIMKKCKKSGMKMPMKKGDMMKGDMQSRMTGSDLPY